MKYFGSPFSMYSNEIYRKILFSDNKKFIFQDFNMVEDLVNVNIMKLMYLKKNFLINIIIGDLEIIILYKTDLRLFNASLKCRSKLFLLVMELMIQ